MVIGIVFGMFKNLFIKAFHRNGILKLLCFLLFKLFHCIVCELQPIMNITSSITMGNNIKEANNIFI